MKIHIIGAGGVASQFLPVLNQMLKGKVEFIIQDADVLEKRNLDRQVFDESCVGMNKAEALLKTCKIKGKVLPTFFAPGGLVDDDVKLLVCLADNNACREAVLDQGDQQQIPVIIAGNETVDAMALIYFPPWKDTKLDPRTRYPEIITDETRNPIRCTDETVLEAAPQTRLANLGAAVHALNIFRGWFMDGEVNCEGRDPASMAALVEIYSTQYGVTAESRTTLR